MLFKRTRASQALSPTEVNLRTDVQIVDVRSRREWQSGRVSRAKHIPLDQLPGRLEELDRAQPVAFICQSGARSKMATKLAAQAGLDAININGGMSAWQRSGLPTSTR
ncbi:MAG: rhodanese-like domain-containing protein [Solirubrobacteraceae bacterium]